MLWVSKPKVVTRETISQLCSPCGIVIVSLNHTSLHSRNHETLNIPLKRPEDES